MVNNSTWLVVAAGILAVIGSIINIVVDRDNIYDMTTSGLFVITFILAFVGAYLAQRGAPRLQTRAGQQQQPQVSKTA
jgi:uncharacterized membrane protein